MAAIAITPAAPVSKVSACRVDVTGAAMNDASAYNASTVPTEPEIRYYVKLSKSGSDPLKSEAFAPSTAGLWTWNGIVVPASGTWTLGLYKVAGDTLVTSASVSVS